MGANARQNRLFYGAIAAALLIVVAATANAQQQGGAGTPEAAETSLPAISVTATRNPIGVFDYPGMVSVTTRESAEEIQPASMDDLLRQVPGLDFSNGPRRTGETPSIRGFSGPDVIILLDDARQNLDSGHDGRFFAEPFFLQEVEVVRGSSSALYGSGGTGGVIALRTVEAGDLLRPGQTGGVETFAGFQEVNDEWSTGVLGFTRPAANAELLGGVVYRNSDDIDLGSDGTLQSRDRILSGIFNGGIKVRDDHSFKVSVKRFTNDAIEPNNGQSASADDAVEKEIVVDNARLSYGYANPDNPLLDLSAIVYGTHAEIVETAIEPTSTAALGDRDTRDLATVGFRVDNRSRFTLGGGPFTILTYGVEGYRDYADGETNGAARSGVPSGKADFHAAFAQGQLEFENLFGTGAGLTLIPGVRYDSYESESSSSTTDNKSDEVSPKLAVQLRPVEPLSLFASAARAFRAPALGELYPTGTHFTIPGFGTNSFIANPDLEPQTTDTVEAGAGVRFKSVAVPGDVLQAKGAYFWIDGKNFIDTEVIQPGPPACFPPNCNGTTQSVNVPNAELQGYELEGSYESRLHLVELGFSHIHGENADTGEYLGSLTPDKLTLHAARKLPERSVRFGTRVTHASDFDKTDDATLVRSAYTVMDLYARWEGERQSKLQGFAVTVGVDNVFDTAYARTATGAYEAGRNIKGIVSYRVAW